ncbi:hypothetical protein KAU33_08760 [Candidatus Dependentiae bacterium]|nr:hypothetical protein [Candidatus Dependentiae bacterium]
MKKDLLEWVIGNSTGLSSKTIWATIMDVEIPIGSIPYDRHDFERCWILLSLCDEETKKKALYKLAERYEVWKPFVQYWPELERTFIYESSSKLNKCLQELRDKKIEN